MTFLDLDVTSDESVTAVVQRVIERFGRIDVLVNNAGIGTAGAAEESSVAQDQRLFDINVFGLIRMTKAVLPHMRAQGRGRIINVSSILGLIPGPFMAVYAASKHAVEGYSESLDHEVREHGVRALLVEPGYTKTGFDANVMQPDTPLPVYAEQRHLFEARMAAHGKDGDEPATVAKVIVAAATDPKPKLRYTAGSTARRVSLLRRIAPSGVFDGRSAGSTGCPPEISTPSRAPIRRRPRYQRHTRRALNEHHRHRHHVLRGGTGPHHHGRRRDLRLPRARAERRSVIFLVHLAATLDNWDPRIIDPIAREHHVIAFDNRGVGASTGQVPDSVEAMAGDAYAFIRALEFVRVDIFSFSLGGFVAQALVTKHPDLVRKLDPHRDGPRRREGHRQGRRHDLLRHAAGCAHPTGPEGVPVFNRNATGKPAARAFVTRLEERTVDRDAPIKIRAFQTQLKAIKRWGRSAPRRPAEDHPAHLDRQRRQRPYGAFRSVRGPAPPHPRLRARHLPRLRPRRHLPASPTFAPVAI